MTLLQKDVMTCLIQGMYLRKLGDKYKLYKGNQDPIMWVYHSTIRYDIMPLLKKDPKDKLILSKRLVLQLHGNDWRKKEYKKLRNAKAN